MKLTKDDAKSGLNGHQRPQLHQHHCQHQLRHFNCRSSNCSKWALTNIRSLCNKQNDFALFLDVESPDVVCVTETWLHADIPDSLLCCKGYNVIRCDRNGRGGGVAMFVRNNIKFSPVDIPSEFSMLELTCVDLQYNAQSYRVIGYYRSPGCSTNDIDYMILSVRCLQMLCSTDKVTFILGYFNLPHIYWSYYHAPDNHSIAR